MVGRKGRHGDGRCEQQIPVVEPPVDAVHVVELALAHVHVVFGGIVVRRADARDQPWIHLLLPLRQVLRVAQDVRGPEKADELRSLRSIGGCHFLDDRTKVFEGPRRVLDQAGDVRVNPGVSEIGL